MDRNETAAATIAPADEGAASRTTVARWLLPATGLLLVAVYWPTADWLWDRWTLSVWHNAHGMFIPAVVGYLVWHELRGLRELPAASSAWGFAFLVPALALHVLDTALHTQLLSALSIVVAAPGLSLLFLGAARTRAIAFPLALLAFMLPIPLALTDRLHLVLRQLATWAGAELVPLVGIPVFAEDMTLHTERASLHIAQACSGFSTLYAAVAVAFVSAYTAPSWGRRLAVLLAAIPLAISANWARVVLLTVIVHWRGVDVLETWIHETSGMLTFALALPAILWLGSGRGAGAE
jgi:exosortase